MEKNSVLIAWGVLVLLFTGLLTACSSDNESKVGTTVAPSATPLVNNDPVELVAYLSGVNAEQFEAFYRAPLKQKYPHISLTMLDTKTTLQELLVANTPIDLVLSTGNAVASWFVDTKLGFDHTDLIKKYKYDLNQIPAGVLQSQKQITGGPLFGLPRNATIPKLVYNKDLFDKFGQSYPVKGMTWDEVYELSKRMTRVDSGVQYQGIVINFTLAQRGPHGVGLVDPKTNKSLFTSDSRWQMIVTNLVRFHQITGNEAMSGGALNAGKAAMWATNSGLTNIMSYQVRVDATTYPSYSDLPGVVPGISGNLLGVTSISKHKDQAFQALAYWISKEALLPQVRNDLLEPLIMDPEMWKELGRGHEKVIRENMKLDILPNKLADLPALTPYDQQALAALTSQMEKLITGSVPDVNTALRQAAEATDKAIEAELKK